MSKNKDKLLWVIHEGNYSGANMALEEYFEVLQKMGYQLRLISPSKGTFVDAMLNKGINTIVIPMYPWTRALDNGFFIKGWLKRCLRNSIASLQIAKHALKVNAVCTNTICMISGAIAAKIVNKPHYWFVHEFGEEDHGFRIALPQKQAYKWMHRLSKKIILNSNAVKRKWQEVLNTNKKLELLYNIVNTPDNKTQQEAINKSKRFLMLGQISPAKGHLTAIKAISQLKCQFPDIQLDIIGSIPEPIYINRLKHEIDKLGCQKHINIMPPVKNPYSIFNRYRALLMCSRKEAFGRVSVEALKAGLPVIGANNGGTPEIIKHGKNGFIYVPNNIKSLNKQIEKIITINEATYFNLKKESLKSNTYFNSLTAKKQFTNILK